MVSPTPQFQFKPAPGENNDNPYYQQYCSTLLLLHKPGTHLDNLLKKDPADEEDTFENLHEAASDFVLNDPRCPVMVKKDFMPAMREETGPTGLVEDLLPTPEQTDAQDIQQDPWMEALGPITDNAANEDEELLANDLDDIDDLPVTTGDAERQADRVSLQMDRENFNDALHFIDEGRKSTSVEEQTETMNPDQLNEGQRLVFDVIMEGLALGEQRLVDVSGSAGSGKSFLMRTIIHESLQLYQPGTVRVAAPTGCAAVQLPGGQTLHSLLKLPVLKDGESLEKLDGAALKDLQERLSAMKLLIIDEKGIQLLISHCLILICFFSGMVGLSRLHQIDVRLRQGMCSTDAFGGVSVMLAGDLRQLPPVGDLALFSTSDGKDEAKLGRILYKMFDLMSFQLSQQMRQAGDRNQRIRDILERFCSGDFTEDDWRFMSSRDFERLDSKEQEEFQTSGLLMAAYKKDLVDFNKQKLVSLGTPIFKVVARNSPASGSAFDADTADGLQQSIYLARNCRVLLTRNLWTEKKLVNGSVGTVIKIIFSENNKTDLPDMVLVKFDSYTGPSFLDDEERVVPICPSTANWRSKGQNYTRRQFPFLMAYGISIHKVVL